MRLSDKRKKYFNEIREISKKDLVMVSFIDALEEIIAKQDKQFIKDLNEWIDDSKNMRHTEGRDLIALQNKIDELAGPALSGGKG